MEIISLSGYTELEKLQIAKRYLVPQAAQGQRAQGRPGRASTIAAIRDDHQRLHARSRRPQPRTRDRHHLPQGRAQDRRGSEVPRADQAREHRRLPAEAALLQRSEEAGRIGRRRDGTGVHAGRRRHPVHRDDRDAGDRQAHAHRSARRRDERVGYGGGLVPALALGGARLTRRLLRQARSAHPRPGRRRSEGRSERGHRDGDLDRLAA